MADVKKYLDQHGVEVLWGAVGNKVKEEADRATGVEAELLATITTETNERKAADAALDAKIKANTDKLAGIDETVVKYVTDALADAGIAGDNVIADLSKKIDTKADKATTLAGYGITDAMTAEAIAQAIAAAKAEAEKYADEHDADTTYGIVYDSDAKKIKLVAGGTEDSIDATDFIKDGMISNVVLDENDDLVITFNTDAGAEDIVVPLDKLIDTYVGKETDTVNVTVNGREISAEVVAGSISEAQLSESIHALLDKADTSVQTVASGSANGTIAVDGTDVAVTGLGSAAFANTDAFDAAGAAATAEANAKAYTDAEIVKAKTYAEEKATAAQTAAEATAEAKANAAEAAAKAHAETKASAAETAAKAYADAEVAEGVATANAHADALFANVQAISDAEIKGIVGKYAPTTNA